MPEVEDGNMSASFSGRPDTSVPVSSSLAAPSDESPPTSDPDAGPFVPNIFDLVYNAQRAELSVARPAMQLYLGAQAVDQSTFLGRGASFEVSSKKVPKSDGIEYETRWSGMTLTTRQGQYDARVLVYKTARIAFSELGEPLAKDRRAMDSVLMEIYALIHPPLYKHPNIVTLLALGWGTNPYNPSYRLPTIVIEYADQGNLAALQAREILTSEIKRNLSLDIGRGLQVLHQCGIIHGDVKSENVLIFSDSQNKYVAKLGDFGFSIVGKVAADHVYIGGTTPWQAPEVTSPVPRDLLTKTDLYSYGLTIWRIAMDGMNPFHILYDASSASQLDTTLDEATKRLKNEDLLKDKTQLDQWYPQWIISSMVKLVGGSLRDMNQVTQSLQQARSTLEREATNPEILNVIKSMFLVAHRHGMSGNPVYQQIKQHLLRAASLDPFYGKLGDALGKCVLRNPLDRNLSCVLATLSGSGDAQQDASDPNADMLFRQSLNHHVMSWQAARDLQPSVQTFLLERFRARADADASRNLVNPPECFVLASFYMNGYGTQPNLAEAQRFICHAGSHRHQVARAHSWRICKVTGMELLTNEAYLSMMENIALSGSRAALHDLTILARDRADRVKKNLKLAFAGVGAFFWTTDLIHGFTYAQWMNTLRDTPILIRNLGTLRDIAGYRVNKRGDRVLHIAASCGYPQAAKALLDNFPALSVNQLNDAGETPLLSACRSGHREVVQVLIQCGADPTITTSSNESPLHWLISFDENEVEEVGQALICNGADIRRLTTRPVKYSSFPSGIDADNLPPGTPLTWAVHQDRPDIIRFLVRAAGTARVCVDGATNQPSPMEWASHYHYRKCLEAMVIAMEKDKLGFTYLHFLKAAVHSADMFSMVLRNGVSYMDRFRDTMKYLLEATHRVSFATGIGGFGYTLLYYAVSEAHDLVVEYLLSPETEQLLQAGWERLRDAATDQADIPIRRYGVYSPEHINIPCGDEQRTPLLECVRWNRRGLFDLLISNGAEVNARSRNPFDGTKANWSALHTFAHAFHDSDVSLAEKIIEAGVPVDAQLEGSHDLETPLLVALKNSVFKLAGVLLRCGANINAKCVSSGLITLEYPATVLGQIVASAARGSVPRLRFVLTHGSASVDPKVDGEDGVDFTIEPERKLTALHRAAWAYKGVFDRIPDGRSPPEAIQREQYDFTQNRDIMYELLQHFGASEHHVNARTGDTLRRRTALHLAIDSINLGAVELLLDQDTVDIGIDDADGHTALQLAIQSARHPWVKCDGPCEQVPLPGRRWHCTICPDHDLCNTCYQELPSSSPDHNFNEIALSETCAEMSAKGNLHPVVPPEMEDLVKILNLLRARHRVHATEEALESLHI